MVSVRDAPGVMRGDAGGTGGNACRLIYRPRLENFCQIRLKVAPEAHLRCHLKSTARCA